MTATPRPILSRVDRLLLHRVAGKVRAHTGEGSQRAYAQGVLDAIDWLTGEPMTPLLQEVTR